MASVDTEDDQLLSVIYGDHEPDDWAAKHQITLSELASRLDAKQHFDNRGRQIWTDGFEEAALQWLPFLVAPGTITRSVLSAWRGAASCLHNHPGAPPSTCTMSKRFYNPATGRYGLETSVSMSRIDFTELRIRFEFYTGAQLIEAILRIQGTTGNIQYRNDVGGWTNLGGNICLIGDIHFWHKLKLVVDVDLQEYIRILVDGVEYLMPGIGCNVGGNLTCTHMTVMFYSDCNGVAATGIHWDDFIISHLEP